MSKEDQLRQVLECGIVAVVRSPDSQQLVEVVRALAEGGVTVAEITMTVPGALDVVKAVRAALGDRVLLGAGAILDLTTAPAFLKAGACCLGVGGQLVEPAAVAARNFTRIRELARQYVAVVKETRATLKQ